jgi:hypothetical protein
MQSDDDYEVGRAARVALNKLRDDGIVPVIDDRKTLSTLRQELIHQLSSQPDETSSHPTYIDKKNYRMGFPRPKELPDEEEEALAKSENRGITRRVEYWSGEETGMPWVQVEQPRDSRRREDLRRALSRDQSLEDEIEDVEDDDDADVPSFLVMEAQNLGNELLNPDPEMRKSACLGLAQLGEIGENFLPELEILMTDDADKGVRREALNAIRALNVGQDKREAILNTRPAFTNVHDMTEFDNAAG